MNCDIYDLQNIKSRLIPILEKYGVLKAGIFGSYGRGEATGTSDIDIMFKAGRAMPLSEWEAFESEVEQVLEKDVDLVEFGSLSPRIAREVEQELVVIYDKT